MISLYDMFVSELVFKLYYFKILMVFEFLTKLNRKHFYCSEQSALYESYYMNHLIPQTLFNIELEIDVIPFDNLSHIIGNIIHFQRQWCKS